VTISTTGRAITPQLSRDLIREKVMYMLLALLGFIASTIAGADTPWT
jgi:hypothetical protein